MTYSTSLTSGFFTFQRLVFVGIVVRSLLLKEIMLDKRREVCSKTSFSINPF